MANNLFDMIGKMSSVLNGLQRDVDPNDQQDEMETNLGGLVTNFDEITKVLKSMDSSDIQAIMKEYGDIFAGRESMMKNMQDIMGIINKIRQRTGQDPSLKQKMQQKLPQQKQGQDVEALFKEYQETLKKLGNLQNQINTSR